MKYKIKLPLRVEDCPDYWINYISDWRQDNGVNGTLEEFNKALSKDNGRYIYVDSPVFRTSDVRHMLEFKTEEDYLMFVLKWS